MRSKMKRMFVVIVVAVVVVKRMVMLLVRYFSDAINSDRGEKVDELLSFRFSRFTRESCRDQ